MSRPFGGRERLSWVDAAWRRMESGVHPMTIEVVLVLEGRVGHEAIRRFVAERLVVQPRFRQRVVASRFGPYRWAEDPHFDVDTHLHRVALPAPGDEAALRELAGDLASMPLDPRRPLWQVHLVEGFGEDTVLVVRIHHCVADGVALVRLLHRIADEGDGAGDGGSRRGGPSVALRMLRRPHTVLRSAGRLLSLPPDPVRPLRGGLGIVKRVAWTGPLSLDRLRAAGRPSGATVNDVLLASLAEGLATMGGGAAVSEIRAMVPVDLRGSEGDGGAGRLGNRFGLMILPLPLAPLPPSERLAAVKAATDALKPSPEAALALGILAVLGLSPAPLNEAAVSFFARKASVVVTDVVGPRYRLRIAGHPLKDLIVWAPPAAGLTTSVSLVSYAGTARVGILTDARILPDPERLAAGMEDALLRLEAHRR